MRAWEDFDARRFNRAAFWALMLIVAALLLSLSTGGDPANPPPIKCPNHDACMTPDTGTVGTGTVILIEPAQELRVID